MEPKHHYGYNLLKWKGLNLFFRKKKYVTLIPHETYPKMYYLKFFWREEKTPEYFNIIWSRENSMEILLYRLNYDVWERHLGAPYSDLNTIPAIQVAKA